MCARVCVCACVCACVRACVILLFVLYVTGKLDYEKKKSLYTHLKIKLLALILKLKIKQAIFSMKDKSDLDIKSSVYIFCSQTNNLVLISWSFLQSIFLYVIDPLKLCENS